MNVGYEQLWFSVVNVGDEEAIIAGKLEHSEQLVTALVNLIYGIKTVPLVRADFVLVCVGESDDREKQRQETVWKKDLPLSRDEGFHAVGRVVNKLRRELGL